MARAGRRRRTSSSAPIDLVARELGIDPVDVRRKNFIPPDAFPYDPGILAGLKYDSGDYEKALDRALEIVGYEDFRAEQAKAAQAGPLSRHRLLDLRRDLRRRAVGVDRDESARAGARRCGRARTCAST